MDADSEIGFEILEFPWNVFIVNCKGLGTYAVNEMLVQNVAEMKEKFSFLMWPEIEKSAAGEGGDHRKQQALNQQSN